MLVRVKGHGRPQIVRWTPRPLILSGRCHVEGKPSASESHHHSKDTNPKSGSEGVEGDEKGSVSDSKGVQTDWGLREILDDDWGTTKSETTQRALPGILAALGLAVLAFVAARWAVDYKGGRERAVHVASTGHAAAPAHQWEDPGTSEAEHAGATDTEQFDGRGALYGALGGRGSVAESQQSQDKGSERVEGAASAAAEGTGGEAAEADRTASTAAREEVRGQDQARSSEAGGRHDEGEASTLGGNPDGSLDEAGDEQFLQTLFKRLDRRPVESKQAPGDAGTAGVIESPNVDSESASRPVAAKSETSEGARGDRAAAAEGNSEQEVTAVANAAERNIPWVEVKRPDMAVDAEAAAQASEGATQEIRIQSLAIMATRAARAATLAAQTASTYSAASCHAASTAASAASEATSAAGSAREAAEMAAESEVQRAVERAEAARSRAQAAEDEAAANAAGSSALSDIAREQEEVAKMLAEQARQTDDRRADIGEKSGVWHAVREHGQRAFDQGAVWWGAFLQWLGNVWSLFVRWTCSLGEFVKNTFWRKG